MELSQHRLHHLLSKLKTPRVSRPNVFLKQNLISLLQWIRTLGYKETMEEYELRKLGIFNLLNFFQLLSGLFIFITCLFYQEEFSGWICLLSCLPLLVSFLVLYLNSEYKHKTALIAYFILHPLSASFIFMNGMHLGIDL